MLAAEDGPLSPAEIARRAGVNAKTIGSFLRGDRWPHDNTLASIDKAIGLKPGTIHAWAVSDDAFFKEDPPEPIRRVVPTIDEASEVELARALLARLEARAAV